MVDHDNRLGRKQRLRAEGVDITMPLPRSHGAKATSRSPTAAA
ncbi:hypothetical protein ACFV98_04815 [Streptomyces violascens]